MNEMEKEIRKTFVLPQSIYEKLKYIQGVRGIKNDTEAGIFCIVETFELMQNKYGKETENL